MISVPAFNRVSQGKLTPEIALNYMRTAKDRVNEAKAMLQS